MVSTSELSRVEMLTFFINAYNLISLHLHLLRGTLERTDMKDLKISFTRDHSYMIAAYNYCLAEIEERLFCHVRSTEESLFCHEYLYIYIYIYIYSWQKSIYIYRCYVAEEYIYI
jgi:hypothetical protein